ncbi:MAG: phosphoribosylaminoimidazolesuccinocarboxamide synthase [Vagococcus sp.]
MKEHILYTGKAKNVFKTNDETVLRLEYLDQVTALNGKKKESISGKGRLNNQITSRIFTYLSTHQIKHHWLKEVSDTEQLVKKVDIIPLEVVVRNVSAGSFSTRFGLADGEVLKKPIIECYYKKDELDDPFINDEHVEFLGLVTTDELDEIKAESLAINKVLISLFERLNIDLIDFKLEFGKLKTGEIILSDEISPDTCRLWDKTSQKSLDKDVYRKDLGNLIPVYTDVLNRLNKLVKENV